VGFKKGLHDSFREVAPNLGCGYLFQTFVLFYIKRQLLKTKSVASGTHFHLAVWLQFLWRAYHGTIPAAPPSPPTQAPHQKNFDTYLLD
jgi:hypothetical protein